MWAGQHWAAHQEQSVWHVTSTVGGGSKCNTKGTSPPDVARARFRASGRQLPLSAAWHTPAGKRAGCSCVIGAGNQMPALSSDAGGGGGGGGGGAIMMLLEARQAMRLTPPQPLSSTGWRNREEGSLQTLIAVGRLRLVECLGSCGEQIGAGCL